MNTKHRSKKVAQSSREKKHNAFHNNNVRPVKQRDAQKKLEISTSGLDEGLDTGIHLVPYDENLLERARTQWQFGDWESLATLDRNTLQHHPDRAKLALLSAAGNLQLNNTGTAIQFIRLAQDWGCSKKLVNQMLIAGVYNTLGRSAAIAGQQSRSLNHFENAIRIGTPGSDLKLLMNARQELQRQQIDKARASLLFCDKQKNGLNTEHATPLGITDIIFEDCESINCRFNSDVSHEVNGRTVDRKIFVSANNKERIMFYRPDSKGDIGVLKQIFEDKQYEFGWLPQGKAVSNHMAEIRKNGGIPAIIDAGANIGASCVFFLDRYPKTTILAIEPDLDNCEILRNNCAGLAVRLFVGGLADRRRILYFQDPDQSDWGFRVGEEGSRPVKCIGHEDLLNECRKGGLAPVILKVDIEGGEDLVFSGDCSWMKVFQLIIIELHDWLLPEKYTSRNFMKAITKYEFQVVTRGENLFCFNPKLFSR